MMMDLFIINLASQFIVAFTYYGWYFYLIVSIAAIFFQIRNLFTYSNIYIGPRIFIVPTSEVYFQLLKSN